MDGVASTTSPILPELADKDALGRKGGEIDGHYSAPTSFRDAEAHGRLVQRVQVDARRAVVQQGADLLHGKLEARFAYGFRAALGIGFLKGEIELAWDVRAAQESVRRMDSRLWMGRMPGMTGTDTPMSLSRSTKWRYSRTSKNSCVITKSAPSRILATV